MLLSRVLVGSDAQILKTLLGVFLGLAAIVAGWILYSANGFYSPTLFLTGTIMIPLGLFLLGMSLTGGLGQSPHSTVDRYFPRDRES